MSDRPAADDVQRLERGRRLRALVADGTLDEHDVDAVWTYLRVRERLARAELALAEITAMADKWVNHDPLASFPTPQRAAYLDALEDCADDIRAALRASQGGQ